MKEQLKNALHMIDVPDDIGDCVFEGIKRTKQERTGITMTRSVKRIAIAAVAALLLLTFSVTAMATYTFEVGDNDANSAFNTALSYVIDNAEKGEERDVIVYSSNNGLYDKLVEGRLSGLRPIINVKFKVGGYAFDVDVDAKTLVVVKCSKKVDKNWDEHFDKEGYQKMIYERDLSLGLIEPDVTEGDVESIMAMSIINDYFGFGYCESNYGGGIGWLLNYDTDPMSYKCEIRHCGYFYECSVDSVTGEVFGVTFREMTEDEIIKQTEHMRFFAGGEDITDTIVYETHLHEHRDDFEYIGEFKANMIAIEALGLSLRKNDPAWNSRIWSNSLIINHNSDNGIVYSSIKHNGVELILPEGVDSYYAYTVQPYKNGREINVFIDARTGEVFKIAETEEDVDMYFYPYEIPSAEAPEGMLSEADAQIIVLEDMGLPDRLSLQGFTIELKDGVYEVFAISVSEETGHSYKVDAVTGEIIR